MDSNKQSKQSSSGNLDITQVGNEEHDELASMIESFYKQDSTVKSRLSYNWDRNHRMVDGDQWLVFDGSRDTGGNWQRLTVSKANEYIPRPVTNYLFDAYQTLKSYLVKNKPKSSVRPNSQSSKDKMAAKLATLCLEANWERLKEAENYEYAASCLLIYGTVFKKTYWDSSAGNFIQVPKMVSKAPSEPMPGQPPEQAPSQPEEVQEVDENGYPVFENLPLGEINTDVVEPYRIALDPLATDLHKARWIMEYSIQSIDWVTETYGKEGDGYTGKIEELKEETSLSGSMKRYYDLKNSSGVKGTSRLEETGSKGGDAPLTNSVVVKEYYERPSSKNPNGRMVVVANNICLYAGESPCGDRSEQGDWHPYSECRWEILPGRFWGKSPFDAGCELQKQVNSIDSVIVLTRKTMAIPQKLVPAGSGIQPGQWTGRPGQQIDYRESGGSLPQTIPAAGVDATVFQERAQRVEDLKNVTGAIDILKGDRPQGVNAASALALLYEIGTGKLFPTLDRWKRFTESDQKKVLKLISKKYKEPREDFIRALQLKNKDISQDQIARFIGSELNDNCNVVIEAGSSVPKLQAAQQSRLLEAAQVGTLNLENPVNRREYNKQMGIAGFDNEVGPDMQRAEWENDVLDDLDLSPDNMPVVLDIDNHEIHIAVHSDRMKSPAFMDLSPSVQDAYMQHIQQHEDMMAQKQQAEDMKSMASGQPPQPGAPSPTAPTQVSGRGKGIPEAQSNALRSDALVPGAPNGK
jgi:hypothetical protein